VNKEKEDTGNCQHQNRRNSDGNGKQRHGTCVQYAGIRKTPETGKML